MLMEFMPGGSLDKYLQNPGTISWKTRYQIGIDVGVGITYLHGQDKVHCDLKSMNVLLDNNHRAKITDFGLSRTKSENSTYGDFTGGSILWMAPELFEEDAKNSKEADVYSYGVVLWELGARKFPLSAAKSRMDIYNHVCGPNGRQERVTSDTPPGMARLIGKCWNKRTEIRPKMDEAVKELKEEQAKLRY
jgi:serine/threonine protein kinase